MTKTAQWLKAGLTVAGLFSVESPAVTAVADQGTMPRVRSSNPSFVALIAHASEQSATFRGLIETINGSDGIVYVEAGECGHEVTSCVVGVTAAGDYRMVWIKVDEDKSECDLIASIGHELRHATEILNDSDVRSSNEMFLFYLRNARPAAGPISFETRAAIDAGVAVRYEIEMCR